MFGFAEHWRVIGSGIEHHNTVLTPASLGEGWVAARKSAGSAHVERPGYPPAIAEK